MTEKSLKDLTPLTTAMIDTLPICDIHVHLPGIISPQIAWHLGVKNNFILITKKGDGHYTYSKGPKSLSISDPHNSYIDIFQEGFTLDKNAKPKDLIYNINPGSFKSFDRIMATVQGHRYPPGGIQTEDDMVLLLDYYLNDCIKQKIFYTELQQNIKIAYLLFPHDQPIDARKKLYLLFAQFIKKFKTKGVHLRFLHCFNKTKVSGDCKATHERTLEAARWLEEAQKIAPHVFVGIESAGHEKDESGWPIHLKAGYTKVKELGLGCEAHAGEGIGVEHMLDVIKSLPITRLAHGFQVIESIKGIELIKNKEITLIMMPVINFNLGLCLHIKKNKDNQYRPCAKTEGGKQTNIKDFWQHPFFELFRKHKVKITLSSDNPYIGGVTLKDNMLALSALKNEYCPPKDFIPLKAEELAILCYNGIEVIFSEEEIKKQYKDQLLHWIQRYHIDQEYIARFYS